MLANALTALETPGSKQRLSISFHNFWRNFDAQSSFFVKALSEVYDVEIVRAGRDLQISSVFGGDLLPAVPGARPLRVWWTGEVRDPRGQIFDLHFGFHRTTIFGTRWHRYPLWIYKIDWWDSRAINHVGRLLGPRGPTPRTRFCNFIYSADASIRTEFFLRLNAVRPVDSVGGILNNVGAPAEGLEGKMRVLSDSVFTVAFENEYSPGYVTEKILEALLWGSIPIYWGTDEAKNDFNPEAFIYAEDIGDLDAVVQHVIRIADSMDAIDALTSAPPFRDNRIPYEHTPRFFTDRITDAISGNVTSGIPVPRRWPWNPRHRSLMRKLRRRYRKFRSTPP